MGRGNYDQPFGVFQLEPMMGSIGGAIFLYDGETGEELNRLSVGGPASSPAATR